MIARVLCLCVILVAARARAISIVRGGLELANGYGLGGISLGHGLALAKQEVVDYYAPANYQFKYGVADGHTGDNKQQSEVRVGDTVDGEYSLAEPDGTIRVVKYTADPHNGFNAIVKRIGHAVHPHVVSGTVPVISKAVPVLGAHGLSLGVL